MEMKYSIPESVVAALDEIIGYIYVDEEKDWRCSSTKGNHIFNDIKKVDKWLRVLDTKEVKKDGKA